MAEPLCLLWLFFNKVFEKSWPSCVNTQITKIVGPCQFVAVPWWIIMTLMRKGTFFKYINVNYLKADISCHHAPLIYRFIVLTIYFHNRHATQYDNISWIRTLSSFKANFHTFFSTAIHFIHECVKYSQSTFSSYNSISIK